MLNAVGCFLFATGAPITQEFIGLLILVDTFYFVARGTKDGDPVEPLLPRPVVGE